jgi:hypothetical protein
MKLGMLLAFAFALATGACGLTSSTSTSATEPPQASDSAAQTSYWHPAAGVSWQIQLQGSIDTTVEAEVFDVDMADAPDETLATLRGRGRKIVCYFSAGSSESWRSDFARFAASDMGKGLDGWPGERWLDVRSTNVRAIMTARLDQAKARGCDAVDPDNVDGYANASGFPLTKADAVAFVRFLADEAHARGMAVGLKNALDLVPDVLAKVDFQVNEQCLQFQECTELRPFIDAGKPVLHIEYEGASSAICAEPSRRGFSTLRKKLDLGAWRVPCR